MQERVNGGCTLPEGMKLLEELHGHSGGGGGGRRGINSELWHACAGPLVSLPQPGTLVYYFPQGHTEQVTASTKRMANSHIPCYPGLLSQMMCQVHKVTLHADKDTDEIYAQITLQPVNSENDVFPVPDFGQSNSKQPKEFFCKTLTASDTSTHGGFSVPRRAAEKLFPPLDHSVQPPNQELVVRDLHDNTWTFRHIYRGQPKRHLLTSGWSVFVGSKRLKAGDSILFIRDEKSQLLLGVRRANRQQAILPSSVLSADSMHIGVLAAAAHASANRTPFTIYYNPRACSSEFVVPLANYHRAAYGTQISIGMRFGMMFEAEDSTKRRYMGTIMGISDIDPLRWPNSKWRNLQVEWDEHGCVERPSRVSLWEIETPENIFIFSSPASAFKRPCNSDLIDVERKNMMKRSFQRVPNPGDVIQALLKPQNLNPGFQVGCPPIYSPHVQNNGKTGPSVQPSTIVGCFNQGNQLLNDILLQTGKLKELAESQQQAAPPQCLMEENSTVSDSKVVSSFDSNAHGSQEVANVPMPELNRDDQSCFVESKSNSSGSNANDLNQGDSSNIATMKAPVDIDRNGEIIRTPVMRLPSENLRCELGKNQNCDDIIDPASLLEGDFKIQEKRVDSDDQKPHVDALMPDITDPIFPFDENPRESQNKSWYLENLGWMLKPPPYPMFMKEPTQPEFSASFGKVNLPSLYGADNSRTTSTDISAIVNPEHFSSTCTSEISGDQYLLSFAHDPSSSEMPNYSSVSSFLEEQSSGFLMHCSSRIPSGMQSISSEQTTTTACYSTPYELKGLSGCDEVPIETLNYLNFQVSNENTFATLSMANRSEDSYDASWNSSLLTPSNALASNLGSCQHLQLHVTSDLRGFSPQGPMDNSGGGTSGSYIDAGENSQMNKCARNEISPLRTYTKVQKTGSVGRCIDVTRFSSYNGLVSAIASMFGLEDQLNDLRDSEWKLVYVDYENDMLLLGDDPWEEFVNCVRCIRILSPAEVQQMSHEGLQPMDDPSMTDAYRTEQKQPAQEGLALCEGGA